MVDYLNFDKVMSDLQVDEEELKRMVSEGQIRAYRDEDKMKFRADDISALRNKQVSEPTIILPSAGSIGSVLEDDDEDLLLVEEEEDTGDTMDVGLGATDEDFGKPDDTVVPTLDFGGDGDSNAETLTEELVFDDEGADDTMGFDEEAAGGAATQRIESQATFIDEDEEDVSTQPLDVEDEEEEPAEEDLDEDDIGATIAAPKKGAPPRKSQLISGRSSSRASARLGAPPPASSQPGVVYAEFGAAWAVIVTLTALLLGYVGVGLIDVAQGSDSGVIGWAAENASQEVLKQKYRDPEGAGANFSEPLPVANLSQDWMNGG